MKELTGSELELRWENIRKALQQERADACLLSMNMNLYYATGEVFSGYFYIPVTGEPCLFVKRPVAGDYPNVRHIRKPEQLPFLLSESGYTMPRKLMIEGDEMPYNEYCRLREIFQPLETGNASILMRRLRMIKTPWEIEQMRISARKHEAVYRKIPDCYRPGMTDFELQVEIERVMRLHGSIGYFRAFGVNMDIFMGSLLAGPNAEIPSPFDFALGGGGMHPSGPLGANGTLLTEGMAVMVDMSGNYTAYQTDMTRIFSIGRLPEEVYRAHEVALEMQSALMRIARPGTACSDIYQMAADMAGRAGLADHFMGTWQQAKFVGHGVGLQINELPVLSPRSKDILQSGMTFAFEPKFVFPAIGAVGIENTFLVTNESVEKLTILEEKIIDLKP